MSKLLTLLALMSLTPQLATDLAAQDSTHSPRSTFRYVSPEDVGLSATAVSDLSVHFARWVRNADLIGAEVLLIKDRGIVHHDVVGWSNREDGVPLRLNSLYRIASMTKPFTGTAVLMLIDEGLLGLDQPVSDWLESWDNPASRDVTVRQLLTHTGGWANEGPGPRHLYDVPSVRALVDSVGAEGPIYRPGEAYRYGDAHSFTLAALVEEVSGVPADVFIESRILSPLALVDTYTHFESEAGWTRSDRVNSTYRRTGGEWARYWSPEEGARVPFFYGAGGMLSSALDYARWLDVWMSWLRDDEDSSYPRLLSAELARRAVSPGTLNRGYGLHWYIYNEDPLVFGHGGADGTRAYAVPSEGVILVILSQSRQADVRSEWYDLLSSVVPNVSIASGLPEASPDVLDRVAIELDETSRRSVVGEYVVDSDTLSITEHEGRLRFRTGFWPTYDLVALGDGLFAMGIYEGDALVRVAGPRARIQTVSIGDRVEAIRLVLLPDGEVEFEAVRIR